MGLFFNEDIDTLFVGDNEVEAVYLGSEKVWPEGLPVGTVFKFKYTGTVQEVELPAGKYKLQCWGAQGGTSYGSSNGTGSKGGYSEGVLTLTQKTTLYIFVGGQGSRGSSTSLVNGGWNGGGASVGYTTYGSTSGGSSSSSGYGRSYPACGGGATDISTVTSSMSYSGGRTNRSAASLLARCIVAGGGAGGSYRYSEWTVSDSSTDSSTFTVSGNATIASGSEYFYKTTIGVTIGATYSLSGVSSGSHSNFEVYRNGSFWKAASSWTATAGYTYSCAVLVFNSTYNASVSVNITESITTTTSYTDSSSGYSNKSQQGGGTSGRGQHPGTQSSGGSGSQSGGFGYGANQETTNYRYAAGGGGGGWYGGGTSYSDSSTSYVNYTGGGSGFVNTAANAQYRPSGYTGLQLDRGTTTAGNTSHPSTSGGTETGHSGNGYAIITVIE